MVQNAFDVVEKNPDWKRLWRQTKVAELASLPKRSKKGLIEVDKQTLRKVLSETIPYGSLQYENNPNPGAMGSCNSCSYVWVTWWTSPVKERFVRIIGNRGWPTIYGNGRLRLGRPGGRSKKGVRGTRLLTLDPHEAWKVVFPGRYQKWREATVQRAIKCLDRLAYNPFFEWHKSRQLLEDKQPQWLFTTADLRSGSMKSQEKITWRKEYKDWKKEYEDFLDTRPSDDMKQILEPRIVAISNEGIIIENINNQNLPWTIAYHDVQVAVKDSTTGQRHHLLVHPRFENRKSFGSDAAAVHAAIAWTFNLKPEEYHPRIQS